MKTTAVRLYGKGDLRLETFELPPLKEGEILAKIISDSICMSSYKAAMQGSDHKRVPDDIATNPVIIGHEFCGEILEVGAKWSSQFKPGQRFAIQPAINDPANVYAAPGYTFPHIGGDATTIIIPEIVMERGCLLNYEVTLSTLAPWPSRFPASSVVSMSITTPDLAAMNTSWALSRAVTWPCSLVSADGPRCD
jgi:NADPH:quinone reductase-like Zn-dependent oxidoreductase